MSGSNGARVRIRIGQTTGDDGDGNASAKKAERANPRGICEWKLHHSVPATR